MSSSEPTSHGSTKVDPIDVASGRTRFSMRLSIDEKPTSAPASWSARAMPHAIEWSLATPKMSAVLPSSSPIRSSRRAPSAVGSLPSADDAATDSRRRPDRGAARPELRARCRRRHRPEGRAAPGFHGGAAIRPRRARHPVPRRDELLAGPSRRRSPTGFAQRRHRHRPGPRSSRPPRRRPPTRRPTIAGRRLFVLAADDARREFEGQHAGRPRTRRMPSASRSDRAQS